MLGQTGSQAAMVMPRSGLTPRPARLGKVDRGVGRGVSMPVLTSCFKGVQSGKAGQRDTGYQKNQNEHGGENGPGHATATHPRVAGLPSHIAPSAQVKPAYRPKVGAIAVPHRITRERWSRFPADAL